MLWLVFVKWVHVVSASFWTGGIIFEIFMSRGLRKDMPRREVTRLMSRIGEAVAMPMRLSLYLAIATGILITIYRGISPLSMLDWRFLQTRLGGLLALKSIIVIVAVALAVAHRAMARKLMQELTGERYPVILRHLLLVGRASLLIALAATAIGTLLRFS